MKTLLVMAEQAGFSAAIKAVLAPDRYRLLSVVSLREVEALLGQGLIDACLLDVELNNIQPIRLIEQIRRWLPECPLLVYATARQWEWEEEAWVLGVTHLLAKPVRGRLLNLLLDRLWKEASLPAVVPPTHDLPEPRTPPPSAPPARPLEVLRHFSSILTHSLCAEALLKQFLLLLREIIGVNRAAIFLRQRPAALKGDLSHLGDRRLHTACALGLTAGLLQHFELSLEAGIGQFVNRYGRILRRGSEEALADRGIQKEFELLGAQVAIPILDRETLLGVAVFDRPVTGEPFGNEELTLIFHLLEELGLAIRNSWLHDQLAASHGMMADILDQIGSACILVGRNLEVLHANQSARALFGRREAPNALLEFSHLPQPLGKMVYEALQSTGEHQNGKYRPAEHPETVYRVLVTPFLPRDSVVANAALLVVEDFTQSERSQALEIEAAKLRLVKTMAEHLAHEIGNSLTPLSAHQQLLADSYADPEFRASLSAALASSVHRISRLSNQMFYLAGNGSAQQEAVSIGPLVEDAFRETQQHFQDRVPRLNLVGDGVRTQFRGNRPALREAVAEVLLNALQAQPENPEVQVRIQVHSEIGESKWLVVEVLDGGPGFSFEEARKATEPFYSTKVVGLGLGLTVARHIVEVHGGSLEIVPSSLGDPGLVRISLPLRGV